MGDSASDKQIKELLQIKLGLQQNTEKLFDRLLNGKDNDPLDDIFKNLTNKNRQIQNLTNQLTECQRELAKLKREKGVTGTGSKQGDIRMDEPRNKSLPGYEELKKNVEKNKKQIQNAKTELKRKSEAFIVFLIKCLRELAKANIASQEQVKSLVSGFEENLKRQQSKILGIQHQGDQEQDKSPSEASTKISRRNQQVEKILKELSKEKNPQKLFTKINVELGLQDIWNPYIEKLKQQSKMYHELKKYILEPSQQESSRKIQTSVFNPQQILNQSFWQISTQKISQKINYSTSKDQSQSLINSMLEDTRKQLTKAPVQAFQIIKFTVRYFYEKLDRIFVKHNQHPYEMVKRPNFNIVEDKVRAFMVNKDWENARKELVSEIDQAFHFIERRTKFYSANRTILRNTA